MNPSLESNIKLVATDLDGTLLDSRKRVPEGFFEAARELHRRGVRVVIASGRQYQNILKVMAPIRDIISVFADNGGFVFHEGKRIFASRMSDAHIATTLRAVSAIPGTNPILCGAEAAYALPGSPLFDRDFAISYDSRVVADDALERAASDLICKVAVHYDGDAASDLWPKMKAFEGEMAVMLSGEAWVDLMEPDANKGAAMREYQRLLGLSPDECMCFGDLDNDKGMLAACTESYCVENGIDSVKAVCKYIAPSNDDGGVMRVLRDRFRL